MASEESKEAKVTLFKNPKQWIANAVKSGATFIWNNKKKELIGRTFLSWGYLGVMYSIFYGVLGAFGWALIAILMATALSTGRTPRYVGSSSPLAVTSLNPGMGVRPHLGFSNPAISNSDDFTQTIKLILANEYSQSILKQSVQCDPQLPGYLKPKDSQPTSSSSTSICTYDLARYLNSVNCTSSLNYGFSDSPAQPCVLVKLNNIITWMPGAVVRPPVKEWPTSNAVCSNATDVLKKLSILSALTNTSYIYVTCQGQDNSNTAMIKQLRFMSPLNELVTALATSDNGLSTLNNCVAGIPFYYFPYTNPVGYMQPKVVVKVGLGGSTANLQCTAWNGNINVNQAQGYGYVSFSLTA